MFNRRGQVTIFVIIGIIIVVGTLAFFLLRQTSTAKVIPEDVHRITSYNVCYTKLLRHKNHYWLISFAMIVNNKSKRFLYFF